MCSSDLYLNGQQPSPSVNLSVSTALPGDPITVTASHLPANQVGTIQLQSSPVQIGTFQADRYGTATSGVSIPRDATPGDHLIRLCWNESCPAGQRLTVLQSPPSPTPTPTPTPAPTPTPTPLPTPTPTPTPVRSPSASPSP